MLRSFCWDSEQEEIGSYTDFERFLGEKSKELVERLEEAKDVMKRLKERG